MNQTQPKQLTVEVTDGQCEFCGYDYPQDHVTIPAYSPLVKCPKCGKYSQNFDADYCHIPPNTHDWEKENYTPCPVCGKTIDYHTDGFISYADETIWVHGDHTAQETEKALNRPLTELERAWIEY